MVALSEDPTAVEVKTCVAVLLRRDLDVVDVIDAEVVAI